MSCHVYFILSEFLSSLRSLSWARKNWHDRTESLNSWWHFKSLFSIMKCSLNSRASSLSLQVTSTFCFLNISTISFLFSVRLVFNLMDKCWSIRLLELELSWSSYQTLFEMLFFIWKQRKRVKSLILKRNATNEDYRLYSCSVVCSLHFWKLMKRKATSHWTLWVFIRENSTRLKELD